LIPKLVKLITLYKKERKQSRKPKRIILIRHAHSEGNADSSVYTRVPDHQVELTEIGHKQARCAGAAIKRMIGQETVRFFVSPYTRSQQTLNGILERMALDASQYSIRVDPRYVAFGVGHRQLVQKRKRSQSE
jgi:broad specificity phosphatase PhoE